MGELQKLSAATRIHRVAHRIGIVFGGSAFAVGLLMVAFHGFNYHFGSPAFATRFEDVYAYPRPKLFNGDIVQFDDGKSVFLSDYLATENVKRSVSYFRNARDFIGIGAFVAAAGLFLYGAIRALGWIVAGAFS